MKENELNYPMITGQQILDLWEQYKDKPEDETVEYVADDGKRYLVYLGWLKYAAQYVEAGWRG